MSKVKRKVTVDTGKTVPEDGDNRKKQSVFARLGPGGGPRKFESETDRDHASYVEKCRNWLLTGNCPFGPKCKFQHGPYGSSGEPGRPKSRKDDSSDGIKLRLKGHKDKGGERRRSESGSPERKRSQSHGGKKEKDTRMKSTIVVTHGKKHAGHDSDVESADSGNWAQEDLDFKNKLELEKRRQQIQRELSQLESDKEEERENFTIEKRVSSSASDHGSSVEREKPRKKGLKNSGSKKKGEKKKHKAVKGMGLEHGKKALMLATPSPVKEKDKIRLESQEKEVHHKVKKKKKNKHKVQESLSEGERTPEQDIRLKLIPQKVESDNRIRLKLVPKSEKFKVMENKPSIFPDSDYDSPPTPIPPPSSRRSWSRSPEMEQPKAKWSPEIVEKPKVKTSVTPKKVKKASKRDFSPIPDREKDAFKEKPKQKRKDKSKQREYSPESGDEGRDYSYSPERASVEEKGLEKRKSKKDFSSKERRKHEGYKEQTQSRLSESPEPHYSKTRSYTPEGASRSKKPRQESKERGVREGRERVGRDVGVEREPSPSLKARYEQKRQVLDDDKRVRSLDRNRRGEDIETPPPDRGNSRGQSSRRGNEDEFRSGGRSPQRYSREMDESQYDKPRDREDRGMRDHEREDYRHIDGQRSPDRRFHSPPLQRGDYVQRGGPPGVGPDRRERHEEFRDDRRDHFEDDRFGPFDEQRRYENERGRFEDNRGRGRYDVIGGRQDREMFGDRGRFGRGQFQRGRFNEGPMRGPPPPPFDANQPEFREGGWDRGRGRGSRGGRGARGRGYGPPDRYGGQGPGPMPGGRFDEMAPGMPERQSRRSEWENQRRDEFYVPGRDVGRDGPPRDGPPRDGPPRDGPPRDGPPRDGPPRDGPPRDDRWNERGGEERDYRRDDRDRRGDYRREDANMREGEMDRRREYDDDQKDESTEDRQRGRRDQSSDRKVDQSSDRKRDLSSDRKVDQSSDRKVDQSSDRKRDLSIDQKGDQSSDRKRDLSSDRKGDQSSDRKRDQSSDHRKDQSSDSKRDQSTDKKDQSNDKKKEQLLEKRKDQSSDVKKEFKEEKEGKDSREDRDRDKDRDRDREGRERDSKSSRSRDKDRRDEKDRDREITEEKEAKSSKGGKDLKKEDRKEKEGKQKKEDTTEKQDNKKRFRENDEKITSPSSKRAREATPTSVKGLDSQRDISPVPSNRSRSSMGRERGRRKGRSLDREQDGRSKDEERMSDKRSDKSKTSDREKGTEGERKSVSRKDEEKGISPKPRESDRPSVKEEKKSRKRSRSRSWSRSSQRSVKSDDSRKRRRMDEKMKDKTGEESETKTEARKEKVEDISDNDKASVTSEQDKTAVKDKEPLDLDQTFSDWSDNDSDIGLLTANQVDSNMEPLSAVPDHIKKDGRRRSRSSSGGSKRSVRSQSGERPNREDDKQERYKSPGHNGRDGQRYRTESVSSQSIEPYDEAGKRDLMQVDGGNLPPADKTTDGEPKEEEDDNMSYEAISSEEDSLLGDDEKPNIVDALDIDWSSLIQDTRPKVQTGSALQRFKPASIFAQIGVSKEYAGEALFEKITSVCAEQVLEDAKTEDRPAEGQDEGGERLKTVPTFQFHHDVALFHTSAVRKVKERANLLRNLGPYRRALCARRDLEMRRQLCKVDKVLEQPVTPWNQNQVIDSELCKLSIQLFRQAQDRGQPAVS